jgi:3-oxoacyl-[acyl-carrier protein] reductase
MNSMTNSQPAAVVTGATRDIGRAVALRLARDAMTIAVCHRPAGKSEANAAETVRLIEEGGGKARAFAADVTKPEDVERLAQEIADAFGAVAVLVNNAGGLVARKTIADMDEAFWDSVINLNLTSAFRMVRAMAPLMSAGGAIVNVSSQAGRDGGGPGSIAYATAKGGMITFTRGLAKELAPRRIRVNCVCPGMINTDFHNIFTKPEVRQRVAAATPVGREGEACEVANLVAFLASGEASFINGASVDINGGILFS